MSKRYRECNDEKRIEIENRIDISKEQVVMKAIAKCLYQKDEIKKDSYRKRKIWA